MNLHDITTDENRTLILSDDERYELLDAIDDRIEHLLALIAETNNPQDRQLHTSFNNHWVILDQLRDRISTHLP